VQSISSHTQAIMATATRRSDDTINALRVCGKLAPRSHAATRQLQLSRKASLVLRCRVSVENDEVMQDPPERAMNKVFARLKNNRNTDREHVELIFNLQQTVLDGLEYLEENKRELPIWGISLFDNHQVCCHPEYTPPATIRALIQHEMDLVDKDFDKIIDHWESLKRKVDRHLDILLQRRVLEEQEVAMSHRYMATQQRNLAIEEAKSSRVQSGSVMIFTAITITSLPLSLFTSYFGMNLADISKTNHDSRYFWLVAGLT
jgi:Mg2+ and Co2+ transporter CorA